MESCFPSSRAGAPALLALFALLAVLAPAQVTPVRIMPLGDSITEASTGTASYRYWLWNEMMAAGYNVDFVGSMHGVWGGPPLYAGFDQDHEGHWGWRTDEILAQIGAWAAAAQPDVVLVHLGHNDLWQSQTVASTVSELGQLITELRLASPGVTVLLAQLIAAAPPVLASTIPVLNAQLPGLAASLTTLGSPVEIVDQFTGFDPATDTWDGVHPNGSGEMKMTNRWLAALAPHLGPFKLVLSQTPGAGSLAIRNLAGPSGHQYLSVATLAAANAGGGLGSGWFAGLHITLAEVVAQYLVGAPPFLGTLDAAGASVTVYPPGTFLGSSGHTLYAVSRSLDPMTGFFTGATAPIAFTFP